MSRARIGAGEGGLAPTRPSHSAARRCRRGQRNGRDENAAIKAGETPEGWADKPAKTRQKDTDARWTKKHGRSHYGYKNHVNVDRRHKLIRRYTVSDAALMPSVLANARRRIWGSRRPGSATPGPGQTPVW